MATDPRTDQHDGVESIQNMTVGGGLTEAEGDICDEDVPGCPGRLEGS